jgi:hypothetical protein
MVNKTIRWVGDYSKVTYHQGWTQLRCKVLTSVTTTVVLPAAAPALSVVLMVGAVDAVAAAAVAGFKFMRLESESSIDTLPSSHDHFDAAAMMANPAAPPAVEPA